MGHLADSDGRVRDSRSQGHEFEYHVGCRGYLYKLNFKKKIGHCIMTKERLIKAQEFWKYKILLREKSKIISGKHRIPVEKI